MPELDIFRSYLATIETSVGSNMFRHLYFSIDGEVQDMLEDGNLSCANYVSSVLLLSDLIQRRHVTVNGTLKDCIESGWHEILEPRKGALVLWDVENGNEGTQGKHRHVGFYIDGETAISNSSDERIIVRHHPTFGTLPNGEARRAVQAYYWHDKLNSPE